MPARICWNEQYFLADRYDPFVWSLQVEVHGESFETPWKALWFYINRYSGTDSMLDEKEIFSKTRAIDPATCERDYDGAEVEFMQALEKYKMTSGRRFPTCSEILTVLRSLGYVRVMPLCAATE